MATAAGLNALVAQRGWRRWTLASFLARLPVTMTLIALVLVGDEAYGSLALGAQLAGVATFTAGLAAQWRGRQLDRGEVRAGLQRACVASALVFSAEAAAVVGGLPPGVLFGLAVLQGVVTAAISGGFRALLVAVVPPADVPRANALEAVFVEVAFIAGPALAGILGLVVGPVGVLVAMAASAGLSAAVAARLPHLHPLADAPPSPPWRSPGVRPVYALAFAMGVSVGLLESALPARVPELGLSAASAGLLLALTAAGSGAGGLVTSVRGRPLTRPALRAGLLMVAFGVLLVPVAVTGSLVALGVALLVCGVPIAPLNALGTLVLQDAVPPGRQAEGFAVFIAAILLGAGTGNSVTGQLLERVGPQALLAGAAALPLVAAAVLAVAVATRGSRRPAWKARRRRISA